MTRRAMPEPGPDTSAPTPPISIAELGRWLGELRTIGHKLDVLRLEVGREKPGPDRKLDERTLHQRHVERAYEAVDNYGEAVANLILASRAVDAADALVQITVVLGRLPLVREGQDCDGEEARLDRALTGSVRAIAATIGVTLAEAGMRSDTSTWCDPWPVVDVSGVKSRDDGVVDYCIDGSVVADAS